MAISYGRVERWQEAKTTCICAIRTAKEHAQFHYSRLEMYGELAWVHWVQGDKQKAGAALWGLVSGLVATDDENDPRFIELYNKTSHALGWFAANVKGEQPSLITESGKSYTPVEAGLFGIQRRRLQDYIPRLGISKASLLSLVGMLLASLDLHELAWRAYEHLSKLVFDRKADVLFSVTATIPLPLAARFGSPEDAIELGLRTAKAQVAYAHFFKNNASFLNSQRANKPR